MSTKKYPRRTRHLLSSLTLLCASVLALPGQAQEKTPLDTATAVQAAAPVAQAASGPTSLWSSDSIRHITEVGSRGVAIARKLGRTVSMGASELVLQAMGLTGVPYQWGGNSIEEGFDCSGLTKHLFESTLGLVLPRTAKEQAHDSRMVRVEKEALEPGDLVFFNTRRQPYSHVGVYIGDGNFVHAPRTGAEVRIEDMDSTYWSQRFTGARRAVDLDPQLATLAPTAERAERLDRQERPDLFNIIAAKPRRAQHVVQARAMRVEASSSQARGGRGAVQQRYRRR